MKKIFTLVIATGFAFSASAQHRTAQPVFISKVDATKQAAAKPTASNLIVAPLSMLDTSCATMLYNAVTGGYLAGTNGYGDQEKLMRYSLATYGAMLPATVDTVMAFFGAKYISGNGNITAKIYAADGSGAPGAMLGTSMPVAVSDVDTTGLPTSFVFASPVNLTTDQFFVSIRVADLYATGDSVGIFSSDQCSSVDASAAWDLFDDGTTFAMVSDPTTWDLSISYYILARLTASTAGVQAVAAGALQARVYPNPARDVINVSFAGKANTPAVVALKDMTGRIMELRPFTANASNQVSLSVTGLQAGIYFCEIQHNGVRDVVKVTVQ